MLLKITDGIREHHVIHTIVRDVNAALACKREDFFVRFRDLINGLVEYADDENHNWSCNQTIQHVLIAMVTALALNREDHSMMNVIVPLQNLIDEQLDKVMQMEVSPDPGESLHFAPGSNDFLALHVYEVRIGARLLEKLLQCGAVEVCKAIPPEEPAALHCFLLEVVNGAIDVIVPEHRYRKRINNDRPKIIQLVIKNAKKELVPHVICDAQYQQYKNWLIWDIAGLTDEVVEERY